MGMTIVKTTTTRQRGKTGMKRLMKRKNEGTYQKSLRGEVEDNEDNGKYIDRYGNEVATEDIKDVEDEVENDQVWGGRKEALRFIGELIWVRLVEETLRVGNGWLWYRITNSGRGRRCVRRKVGASAVIGTKERTVARNDYTATLRGSGTGLSQSNHQLPL